MWGMTEEGYDRGPISRRRERDEDGNTDTFWDECPDHPNHPLVECELCQAEEDEEIQDDDRPELRIGDRVRLLPFEDQPEEFGTVEHLDTTTAIVRLDGVPTEEDDHVREVPHDQIERE